jgi:hypothetical protein
LGNGRGGELLVGQERPVFIRQGLAKWSTPFTLFATPCHRGAFAFYSEISSLLHHHPLFGTEKKRNGKRVFPFHFLFSCWG